MQEHEFNTMDLNEIRRLIGAELAQPEEAAQDAPLAEAAPAPAAPVQEAPAPEEAPAAADAQAELEPDDELAEIRRLIDAEPVSKASKTPKATKAPKAAPAKEAPTPVEAAPVAAPAEAAVPQEAPKAEKKPKAERPARPVQQLPEEPAAQLEDPQTQEGTEEAPPVQSAKQEEKPRKREKRAPSRVSTDLQKDVSKALEEHQADPNEKAPKGFEAYTMLHDLVVILAALTLIFVFCVRLVGVAGVSMIPTFYDKDYLILQSNFLYKDIDAGDVIVMNVDAPGVDGPIVKRVIATAGQTVDIDFTRGEVYVDGKLLVEDYIYEPTYESYGSMGLQYPVTVPEGHIFVMGDDRNHSADSRWSPIGCVDTDRVLGRVLFLVFPGKQTDVHGNIVGGRDFGRIGAVS